MIKRRQLVNVSRDIRVQSATRTRIHFTLIKGLFLYFHSYQTFRSKYLKASIKPLGAYLIFDSLNWFFFKMKGGKGWKFIQKDITS